MLCDNLYGWPRTFFHLLLGGWLVVCNPTAVLADGGTLRQSIHQGNLVVTVFTSPTPPRAGPIDVSILVQDATTGEPLPNSHVQVQATPRSEPDRIMRQLATTDVATNKLMSAAIFDLPDSGTWDFHVSVDCKGETSYR